MIYNWDFSVVFQYSYFWLLGAGYTLAYAFGTIVVGSIIGMILGSLTLSASGWVRLLINGYVQLFRCTPALVQIVWFYYALPIVMGLDLPAWLAASTGLSLYMGAFSTEIFRAGVISIDKGQWQASRALGMTYLELMRHIILPQAVRRMIPPFANQSVIQIKNTALLSVVSVHDLMYSGMVIVAETFRPLETYTSLAVMYFLLIYPLVRLARSLEARVDV